MKSFKIQKIKNVSWGTCTALVNVTVLGPTGNDLLTIRDCKLIQGDFGSFLASPSLKVKEPYENKTTGKMVEYVDVVFFDKNIREELNNAAAMAYDPNQTEGQWYGEDGINAASPIVEKSIDDLITEGIPS
tara:strand:+ start:551 stop:943 length:393 start_codon:yes stop_codon:yes gene_type:complete